jgi:hypothetical protein
MPVTESAQGNTAVKSYPFLILALKLIKVMTTNLLFFSVSDPIVPLLNFLL